MLQKGIWGMVLSGICAGIINGLLGGGGGMILVPMLVLFTILEDKEIFPSSVAIIAPICIVSLIFSDTVAWAEAFPYMIGGAMGGLASGLWGKKIPVLWLHRGLGILILW